MELFGSNHERIMNSKEVVVNDSRISMIDECFSIKRIKRGISLGFAISRDFKLVKNGTTIILIPKDEEVFDFEEEIELNGSFSELPAVGGKS